MDQAELVTYICAIGVEVGLIGIIALSFGVGYAIGKGKKIK